MAFARASFQPDAVKHAEATPRMANDAAVTPSRRTPNSLPHYRSRLNESHGRGNSDTTAVVGEYTTSPNAIVIGSFSLHRAF